MKRFAPILSTLLLAGGLCSAATYTGRLMDADCYNQNKVESREEGHKTYKSITRTCAATPATTNFAVRITGSTYGGWLGDTVKLDQSGNSEAASEMKNGDINAARDGVVHVKIHGDIMGETFQTASVKSNR